MTREPTAFVVDDDPERRRALRDLLESAGLTVSSFASVEDFQKSYDPEYPGVLVLDVGAGGIGDPNRSDPRNQREYELPVIVVAWHGHVPLAVRSLRACAADPRRKPARESALLDRIRKAILIDAARRWSRREQEAGVRRLATLTPREREVMRLLISGRANRQIAHDLGVSEKTIEVHRKRVMKKLGVDSLVELVRVGLPEWPHATVSDVTVFVVDDDSDLCEALRWLLESDGLTVETHTSARDFLNAYNPERPGVLVLDVRMRGMSGLELQEYLNEHNCEIPVIILTGHGDVPMAARSMRAGAVDFLQKPVNDQALLDRVRRAIQSLGGDGPTGIGVTG